MVYDNDDIDEEALMAEIDADFAAGRWRWATPEENARLREAGRILTAEFEAEKRKAAMGAPNADKTPKKQAALVSA